MSLNVFNVVSRHCHAFYISLQQQDLLQKNLHHAERWQAIESHLEREGKTQSVY